MGNTETGEERNRMIEWQKGEKAEQNDRVAEGVMLEEKLLGCQEQLETIVHFILSTYSKV